MVKQNDTVRVDGKVATVTSTWGQGKHKVFALSDGRTVLDLTDEMLVDWEPKKAVTGTFPKADTETELEAARQYGVLSEEEIAEALDEAPGTSTLGKEEKPIAKLPELKEVFDDATKEEDETDPTD